MVQYYVRASHKTRQRTFSHTWLWAASKKIFPDARSLRLIQQSANDFWGPEKTLSAEVLAREGPPKYPTIGQSEAGHAAADAEYQDQITTQRFLINSMRAFTLRRTSTSFLHSSMNCSGRISLLTFRAPK